MTNLMVELRRSPRTLLERDGYPGPGPGHVAVVLARAGVGKTAFLVGIGLDALLSGQKVLHISIERTVDQVRKWYDDLLGEMLRRERLLQHWAGIQLEIERRRHIHTYVGRSFSIARLSQAMDLLGSAMEFAPDVIIFDRPALEGVDRSCFEELRQIAITAGAELWISCRTHRDGPQGEAGHLPPPADAWEDLVDLAFRLDPREARIRLQVLKDRDSMPGQDLNILLDPASMLLVSGVVGKR
jgi:hypothetical protein